MCVSVAAFSLDDTNIAVLTAIKLPQPAASCEQWPEECR
jgi:hypothetical protein